MNRVLREIRNSGRFGSEKTYDVLCEGSLKKCLLYIAQDDSGDKLELQMSDSGAFYQFEITKAK